VNPDALLGGWYAGSVRRSVGRGSGRFTPISLVGVRRCLHGNSDHRRRAGRPPKLTRKMATQLNGPDKDDKGRADRH